MELYAKYGYYCEKVTSFALEGKDGLEKMKKLMVGLRDNAPTAFAGVPIQAVSDYLKGVRVEGNKTETLNFPASDVLFYEMQGGGWVCIRPSGTEPKVKLYVNTVADSAEESSKKAQGYLDAAVEKMNEVLK